MAMIDKSTPIGLTAETNLSSVNGNPDAINDDGGLAADSGTEELSQEQSSGEASGESRN
ncbi:MAG: hypothetical protein JWR67_851 [Mucilaginibacter sp.]|nr:hypothetical protein [Mucilaginibacter sp.]MDB5109737.1 hypothetical protein [Mucilaginibacter sp.]